MGGDSGPALVPREPDKGRLIEAVRYTNPEMEMPPKAQLSQGEIAVLEEWEMRGAPDSRATVVEWKGVRKGASAAGEDFPSAVWMWKKAGSRSYHPVRDTTPPVVREHAWPPNEVDFFTLAKQETAGLRAGPEADSHGWLRRVTFDLTGLPPPAADAAAQSRCFDFVQCMNTRLFAQNETDARRVCRVAHRRPALGCGGSNTL